MDRFEFAMIVADGCRKLSKIPSCLFSSLEDPTGYGWVELFALGTFQRNCILGNGLDDCPAGLALHGDGGG